MAQAEAMKNAKRAILDVAADFEKTFGRKYGLFEAYRMEDAELAIVLMGSSAGTAKAAVDELRESGVKAGLIKIRVFRPFPGEELAEALKDCKAVAVLDKSEGFSLRRPPVRRDRFRLHQPDPAPQDGGHRLRSGRPRLHRGTGQARVCPAGEDRLHRRGRPHLFPHGPA